MELTTKQNRDRLRVYIAGPMRGRAYLNFDEFIYAASDIRAAGFEAISPAELDMANGIYPWNMPQGTNWDDIMACGIDIKEAARRDLSALLSCDAVYMLIGWRKSVGASVEKKVADWVGIPVVYEEDNLKWKKLRRIIAD
jgi:hypothetical protein